MPAYNVLVAAEFHNIAEGMEGEVALRLEEACFEKIPTLKTAWEIKVEATDETEAKNDAVDKFINVVRTYPFELKMLVHAGTGQILRKKKVFEA